MSKRVRFHSHERRVWLYVPGNTFCLEWGFGKNARFCHLTISSDPDDDLVIAVGLPYLFSLFFSIGTIIPYPRKPRWMGEATLTGIRIFDGGIWLSLFADDHQWPHRWGWSTTIHLLDILLGRTEHSKTHLDKIEGVEVYLPEGVYLADVEMFLSTWKRPRWPFVNKLVRATIEVEGGIAVPGKGESDWDIGDDAHFSMTCLAQSAREAAEEFAKSVMRERRKYGSGENWRPDDPDQWAKPAYPNLSGTNRYPGIVG